jgi:hypothetical protein
MGLVQCVPKAQIAVFVFSKVALLCKKKKVDQLPVKSKKLKLGTDTLITCS